MSGDDVVQLINQLWSFEDDMRCPLLKVLDRKHLVLVTIAVPISMDMIAETTGNVSAVVGNRFAIKKHQHAFKVCKPITLPAPVKPKSPPITFDQPRNDDLFPELTWAIALKIPAQPFKHVDRPTLKHLAFALMQLLKCAQNVGFADSRN